MCSWCSGRVANCQPPASSRSIRPPPPSLNSFANDSTATRTQPFSSPSRSARAFNGSGSSETKMRASQTDISSASPRGWPPGATSSSDASPSLAAFASARLRASSSARSSASASWMTTASSSCSSSTTGARPSYSAANSADSNEVVPLTSTCSSGLSFCVRGFSSAVASPFVSSSGKASSASSSSSTAPAGFLLLCLLISVCRSSGADARDDVAEGLALEKLDLGRADEFEDGEEGEHEFAPGRGVLEEVAQVQLARREDHVAEAFEHLGHRALLALDLH